MLRCIKQLDLQLMNELEFALALADKADEITMFKYQSVDLVVAEKPDLTPVTEADKAVEQTIRSEIAKQFPNDSILGEEFGLDSATPPPGLTQNDGLLTRQWIIDPIDGTKNFVRGVPVWATLIALAEGNEVIVGVVSAPAMGRRWWAVKGQGAWVLTKPDVTPLSSFDIQNKITKPIPKRISVSQVSDLAHASLAYASLGGWEEIGKLSKFLQLANRCWRTRGYGDFWSYMLLAEGAVDIAAEPELEIYDMAALVPIVTEAGGKFTSLNGKPGPWDGNAIATNTLLHSQALTYLGPDDLGPASD